ncbi:ZM domain-containing protein [Caenorhabditis elegans]|nr:ZM domain-containing protein [Caenorhabditis elegans]CBX53322.1 ZM domain-containing protein [Caenorhabditis elegans]|eukprot:NP_001257163.1 Uncharacterized protein CELE_F29G6.3 [Caenorhabditis elegans]
MSKATSVSVHSSVSQKSAQHYDLPPIPQYDMPPIVVGEAVVGKAPSVASSRSGSHHSVASHHSHHSQHSHHSALTHDSESTISEGTLVNEPIVVGAHVASEAPTPLAVGQSFEHDAVIEQFKNLHGRDQSVVSSIVPASVHIQSDSEDSIAPSKLTHSIAVGGVVDSHNGVNVLHRSHEVEFVDFAAPAYYQPPSVVGAFDAHSEDSFGFEKVEYVDTHEDHHHKLEEQVPQVVHEHVIEQHYEPYQIVHENHNVLSVDFGEDQHSITHHDHDHHHHHHESHVTHTFTSNVKQSRSNTASTYQSRQMLAHNVGPKITEELRPAAVLEEEEVEVRPPVMAYVAPIPVKPPRTHEESHIYNAYETEIHQQKDIVKSTTVVLEDVRSGSEGIHIRADNSSSVDIIGVSSLRRKFEHGAPPPLSPVFEMKKHEHHKHLDQHHHHKHQDVVVEQTQFQVGDNFISSSSSKAIENHYDVPFDSYEIVDKSENTKKSSSSYHASSSYHKQAPPLPLVDYHVYDTPTVEHFSHSPAFYTDDQRHHYVPQIKVITEYRHINPRHHYVERQIRKADGSAIAQSPQVQTIDYFKEINRAHHFVPSTPPSLFNNKRESFHHHSFIPNSLEAERKSRSVERAHHYLPDSPANVKDQRKIIREHHYVPLEKRSQSLDLKVVHPEHHYVPLVRKTTEDHQQKVNHEHHFIPAEKKTEAVKDVVHEHHYIPLTAHKTDEHNVNITREHHYIPLKTEQVQSKTEIERHNQYVPMTTHKETKSFDTGRSHSYIPLGGNVEQSKTEIFRQHNFVPVVDKKEKNVEEINQKHNYVPAHSNVAVSDKEPISRHHNFVPLATKTVEETRHSNDLSHHHYMPLPAKREEGKTAAGDKVGYEHHYYPLASNTERVSVHKGQEHHYVPLIAKPTESHASKIVIQHQYIPLAMRHQSVPRLPSEHNYIPIAIHDDSHQKVDLTNHQYLPPIVNAEQKEAVKLYEHQYVPLPPKKDSFANYSSKAPQLPREHHYYPAPVRSVEHHQKHVHEQHNYIPAVHHHETNHQLDRQHGYIPVAAKHEAKKNVLYEHQYIPPITRTEQTNGYDRRHNYVPVGKTAKATTTDIHVHQDHQYVPQASPRKTISEKVSEHVQLGGSRKSTIQSGHHHHHHHDHENRNDVPSRPSSVANYVKHQPHSRTSTVSTVRGAPVQRVNPTVQQHVIYNPYGDHQSVRVVKNVREFVNVFGATHVVPPPTPLAGVPRLSQRSPISHETFQPHDECNSVKSSRKNTLVSVGKGIQINDAPRKSTCSSVASSRSSSVSTVSAPILVGGNIAVPTPRSRNATLTQENVHEHDQYDDLIHVADMRKLFENYGPAHLPEYASNPSAYIH